METWRTIFFQQIEYQQLYKTPNIQAEHKVQ